VRRPAGLGLVRVVSVRLPWRGDPGIAFRSGFTPSGVIFVGPSGRALVQRFRGCPSGPRTWRVVRTSAQPGVSGRVFDTWRGVVLEALSLVFDQAPRSIIQYSGEFHVASSNDEAYDAGYAAYARHWAEEPEFCGLYDPFHYLQGFRDAVADLRDSESPSVRQQVP